ncbi:MAG TPA: DedA family protein [Candidatus Flavonifractor merdigallinarum]|uniref:DedA family protein n=1 Tax=Candidatus Flavonifractor merdigallinarum TaxID=2838589 RepID=A0A9D2BYZ8_9FIRM|nr:DedA family protein [Candidatus Flavonifractor merdigallinarum]
MEQFIVNVMEDFGYPGMALLIAVENLFPPIPSEVILTFGGFLTTRTALDVWWVVAWATLGAVAGALVLYGVGRALGGERMRALLAGPWGKRLGFDAEAADRAAGWFEKKGAKTVLFCRCVPILRSLISIPAGMARMNLVRFLLYTTAGSLVWNAALVHLGAAAGESWALLARRFSDGSGMVRWMLAAAAVVLLLRRLTKKKDKKSAAP